ncbi:MAG: S8/S53 family peptidase [bacterium]
MGYEQMSDMAKAAGMCPHGNSTSTCAKCKESAEKNTIERQLTEKDITEFAKLEGSDLSGLDLSSLSAEVLVSTYFDTKTKWPKSEKLPKGFNPEKLLIDNENPGLGIRELHAEGIDGRGVRVAIIDQKLLTGHEEIKDSIVQGGYAEYGLPSNEKVSMHGAVASLFVGKECGVAPGAELVYKATPAVKVREFKWEAKALMDIVGANRDSKTEPAQKIRVVSCSFGYSKDNSQPGLKDWIEAVNLAESEGIIVIDPNSNRLGTDYVGGGAVNDKEDVEDYDLAIFLKGHCEMPSPIVVPSDYRTTPSPKGTNEYMYAANTGMSWAVPYLAGLFTLGLQVNPDLSKQELVRFFDQTAIVNKKGLRVANPRGFIEAIKGEIE